jgi:hypothetical protein
MQNQKHHTLKDINIYGTAKQFWIYKLNGINFYIPNYGNLLLLDHDYHDNELKKYKIISKLMGDDETYISDKIRENAKKCLSPNNFGQEFSNIGGVKPPDDIMNMLLKIENDLSDTSKSLQEIIEMNLMNYVNNRVGTSIRDVERDYIRKNDIRPFKRGDIVIYEAMYDTYQILIYYKNINENECYCISKENINDKTVEIRKYNKDLIYHYSEYDTIKQDEKLGEPYLSLEYVIESYSL